MMAVGNVQRLSQVMDGSEHLVGKAWVLLHNHPFFVGQWAGFEQNPVRNTHLADIMQQGSPADLHQFCIAKVEEARKFHHHPGYSQGMPFGLFVAQVESARPAFDRGIIGHHQFGIGALQVFKQLSAVNGNPCLAGQHLQEFLHFRIQFKRFTMEDLQYPFDLAFGDQRYPDIGGEFFAGEIGRPLQISRIPREVLDRDDLPFLGSSPGVAIANPDVGMLERLRAEPLATRVLQCMGDWIEYQDIGGMHA